MINHILELIENNESIIICGHSAPDGDCYGSQVALKQSIKLKYPNKKVYIVGSGLPQFFECLLPMDNIPDEIFRKSLLIIVDANDINRLEDKRSAFAKSYLKIDHHIDTGSFVEGPYIVDEQANSTCDIITGFLKENNFPFDSIVATALYLGILTDSGRFQFVTRYEQTFLRAAYLCANGADINLIQKKLNISNENDLAIKAYMLSNYKKTQNGVLYILLDLETLKSLNTDADSISHYINLLADVKEYPVWVSFAQRLNGETRVEVRSNGPEVQPLMAKFGGGGHMYAAGATVANYNIENIKNILDLLDDAVLKWKK